MNFHEGKQVIILSRIKIYKRFLTTKTFLINIDEFRLKLRSQKKYSDDIIGKCCRKWHFWDALILLNQKKYWIKTN